MQASTAKNETRLPRSILKRSAELNAKYVDKPNEPDTNAPVGQPPTISSDLQAPSADTKPQPPAAAADPRENDPAYWKQRFKVTAGVLDAERKERNAETLEFNRRMTEMQEQISQLQANIPPEPSDLGKYFTPEQVEEMGEETARAHVNAIEKQVKLQVDALFETRIKPLQSEREAEQQNQLRSRKQAFTDRLTELVPDYLEIDTPESGFHSWLATLTDDGEERQRVLDRHVVAFNAEAVAKVFQAFKKTKQPPAPPVAPHGSGAGPSGSPPVQPNAGLQAPSKAEIREYYTQAALGKVTAKQREMFEARLKLMENS